MKERVNFLTLNGQRTITNITLENTLLNKQASFTEKVCIFLQEMNDTSS